STELAGAHPQHGSSTGTNFNINPEKQLWHCWRHGSGGDALTLLAVCEGILACEQANPGGLRGMDYVQAVTIANDQWQAGIVLDERQARLDAQTAADDALTQRAGMAPPPQRDDGTRIVSPAARPGSRPGPVHHILPDHLKHHPD